MSDETWTETHRETITHDQAIWQSDTAKTYRCPHCTRSIFTQYEGDDAAEVVTCEVSRHVIVWRRPAQKG